MRMLLIAVGALFTANAMAAECESGAAQAGVGCNEAGNVPVGDTFCHMSTVGLGDCQCDFTQASGDEAFPGTVTCGGTNAPGPNACEAVEELYSLDPDIVVTKRGSIIVSYDEGQQDEARVGGGTEYWCTCSEGGGSCNVKMFGTTASCVSMSCTKCTLNSRKIGRSSAVQLRDITCGAAAIDDAAVDQRLQEIAAFRRGNNLPEPRHSRNGREAWAPLGYDLVLERVGGRELVYVVPEDPTASPSRAVGPATQGDPPIQARIGKPKVKCNCSGEGSCSFTMDNVCVPASSCSGTMGCTVTVKGARSLQQELGGTRTLRRWRR